jgi:membrane protease YdiL (CAAX protease family)
MRRVPLVSALLVMLAVWTILSSGSMLSSLIGEEPATLLVFSCSAALLIVTRRPSLVRLRLSDAALLALTIALGFAGHSPLRAGIALVGLALGLAPSLAAPPGGSGLPLLVAVVVAAPVFEELLYRERLLDAIAATPLRMGGAVLLTSALFALTHLSPWQMLGSFLVGVVLALIRRVSGTVTACIGFHVGLNLRSVWDSAVEALHG